MYDKKVIHIAAWAKTFNEFRKPQILRHKAEFKRVVLYCSDDPAHVEMLERDGFEIKLSPMSKNLDLRVLSQIIRLYRYLKKENFDIIFAQQNMGGLIGVLAGRLAGTPLIIYGCAGLKYQPDRKGLINWLMKFGEFKIVEWSDAVFVNNRDDERILKDVPGTRDKVRYVGPCDGCGVDTGVFNAARRIAGRDAARAELGIGKDVAVLGFVGRCVWEKGLRELVDAAVFLRQDRPAREFRIIIIGDGVHSGEIARYAEKKGVGDAFDFLGYKFGVDYYISALDIFVLPSHREGLSVSLLQALSMGLPSVTTRTKGSWELIQDGKTGYIVPVGDARALADALLRIVDDPGAAKAMGLAASRYVAANFGEKVLVDNLAEITRELIEIKWPSAAGV